MWAAAAGEPLELAAAGEPLAWAAATGVEEREVGDVGSGGPVRVGLA